MLDVMGDPCRHEAVASTPGDVHVFLKEKATFYHSSALARPKFTIEEYVLGNQWVIRRCGMEPR
jgi:hypothetical protein